MDTYTLVKVATIAGAILACIGLLLILPISILAVVYKDKFHDRMETACMVITVISFLTLLLGGDWLEDHDLQKSYISAGYTIVSHELSRNSGNILDQNDNLLLEKNGNLYWADCDKDGKHLELFCNDELIAFGERYGSFTLLIKEKDRAPLTLSDYQNLKRDGDVYIKTYS